MADSRRRTHASKTLVSVYVAMLAYHERTSIEGLDAVLLREIDLPHPRELRRRPAPKKDGSVFWRMFRDGLLPTKRRPGDGGGTYDLSNRTFLHRPESFDWLMTLLIAILDGKAISAESLETEISSQLLRFGVARLHPLESLALASLAGEDLSELIAAPFASLGGYNHPVHLELAASMALQASAYYCGDAVGRAAKQAFSSAWRNFCNRDEFQEGPGLELQPELSRVDLRLDAVLHSRSTPAGDLEFHPDRLLWRPSEATAACWPAFAKAVEKWRALNVEQVDGFDWVDTSQQLMPTLTIDEAAAAKCMQAAVADALDPWTSWNNPYEPGLVAFLSPMHRTGYRGPARRIAAPRQTDAP